MDITLPHSNNGQAQAHLESQMTSGMTNLLMFYTWPWLWGGTGPEWRIAWRILGLRNGTWREWAKKKNRHTLIWQAEVLLVQSPQYKLLTLL